MPQSQVLSKDKLQEVINHSQVVIDGLADNPAWRLVLNDIKKQQTMLDNTWQFVTDSQKLMEFRATKMAVMKIVNLIADYKADRDRASQQLRALDNPKSAIVRDVDNE